MNPQKKIILVSPFFKSPAPGGGATLSREICKEWLNRGSEVHVFGIDFGQSDSSHKNLFFHGLIKYNDSRLSHKMSFSLKEETLKLISSIAPDEIHIHNFHGMLGSIWAAVESGFKTIYTALDFGLACQSFYLFDSKNEICSGPEPEKCHRCISEESEMDMKYFSKHLFGFLKAGSTGNFSSLRKNLSFFNLKTRSYVGSVPENLKFMLPLFDRFDHVIAPSPPMAKFILKYRNKGQIHELGYPISNDRIFKEGENLPSDGKSLRLLFLGNSAKVKGWSFFLEVLESLPDDLDLEVIDGGGITPLNKTNYLIRRYLKKSERLASGEVARAIVSCDATVVPSVWYENTPLVTLESLVNGRPVIASDQPGISNVIQSGRNGFLLPPSDLRVWVNNLIQWAQNPKKVREMQGQCTYTFNVADYMNALEKAIL